MLDKTASGAHVYLRAAAGASEPIVQAGAIVMESSTQSRSPYAATTRDITVMVQPYFLEEQSVPEAGHFVWAYHVRIQNGGEQTVQLLTRHWMITDAHGNIHEVRGDGVVGKQPVLRPGDVFEYASGTPLATPSGIMMGSYQMQAADTGEHFDITIPAFSLDSPHHHIVVN